jgi:hypothetical protein
VRSSSEPSRPRPCSVLWQRRRMPRRSSGRTSSARRPGVGSAGGRVRRGGVREGAWVVVRCPRRCVAGARPGTPAGRGRRASAAGARRKEVAPRFTSAPSAWRRRPSGGPRRTVERSAAVQSAQGHAPELREQSSQVGATMAVRGRERSARCCAAGQRPLHDHPQIGPQMGKAGQPDALPASPRDRRCGFAPGREIRALYSIKDLMVSDAGPQSTFVTRSSSGTNDKRDDIARPALQLTLAPPRSVSRWGITAQQRSPWMSSHPCAGSQP